MRKSINKAKIVIDWAIVATIVGIICAYHIAVSAYNHQYNSSAQATDTISCPYTSTKNSRFGTIDASAGSVWFGAYQNSGKTTADYDLYYKKSNKSSYSFSKSFAISKNGATNAVGDWKLVASKSTQKYDIKVNRTSQKTSKAELIIDWCVDDYNSTGH